MGAFVERHYPWVLGVVTGLLCYRLLRGTTIPPGTKDLFSSFLNIAAIMVGFLWTAKSILLSIDEKWIIQRSKEAGAYEMLVGYMVSSTYWWLFTALASAIGVAVLPATLLDWQRPIAIRWFSGWVAVAASASFAALRVLSIFSTILRSVSRPKSR